MTLQFNYHPEIDRFAVYRGSELGDINTLKEADLYKSIEYYRYVPIGDVSLEAIDAELAEMPRELCCEVTTACNLVCKVCIASAPARLPSSLPLDRVSEVVKLLPQYYYRVTITGGEPSLYPYLHELLELCASGNRWVVLSTNGYEPGIIRSVLERIPRIILAVSLHGPQKIHDSYVGVNGSYERAISIIEGATSITSVQVLTTASQETLPYFAELTHSLSEFKITEHRVNMIKPGGRNFHNVIGFDNVAELICKQKVPHKISLKRRDQPFRFLNYLGKMEDRREREYG